MRDTLKLTKEDANSLVLQELVKQSSMLDQTIGENLSIATHSLFFGKELHYELHGERIYHGKMMKFIQDCSYFTYQELLKNALEEIGYTVDFIDTRWDSSEDVTYYPHVKIATYQKTRKNKRR